MLYGGILTRVTPPTSAPVTLDEVKQSLRIRHTNEDDFIQSKIDIAAYLVGGDIDSYLGGKVLLNQTWKYSVKCADGNGRVFLPLSPGVSLTSIQYYDADEALQSFDVNNVYLFSDEDTAYIELKSGQSWPTLYDRKDALQITYVCGFGANNSDVPDTIRHAIILIASDWYENRGNVTSMAVNDLPFAATALINTKRKGWVA